MHRSIDPRHPFNFITTVGGTGNGIVTPLVSVPFLLVGPRNPHAAMLAQPLLMVVASVGVAGITRRLAGPLAGHRRRSCSSPCLPTTLSSRRSRTGTGSAPRPAWPWPSGRSSSSDRCDNGYVWWFGVAVGLMFLSRTMTLGYAPAVAVAGLVVAGWDRRRLLRLVGAGLVAVAVAGPWYFWNRGPIFDYLFSYGYGDRAARFGPDSVVDRAELRIDRLAEAVGAAVATVLVVSMVPRPGSSLPRRWCESQTGTGFENRPGDRRRARPPVWPRW